MTDIEPGLIGLFIMVPFLITVVVSIYIAHAYTNKIEALLPNCAWVQDNKKMLSNAGLPGKTIRCSMIYLFLLAPNFGRKRKLLDPIEIRRLPKAMRYLILVPWTAQIILTAALIGFVLTFRP
jgi:hypothetical protein